MYEVFLSTVFSIFVYNYTKYIISLYLLIVTASIHLLKILKTVYMLFKPENPPHHYSKTSLSKIYNVNTNIIIPIIRNSGPKTRSAEIIIASISLNSSFSLSLKSFNSSSVSFSSPLRYLIVS